jgi:hypothetical protein
MTDDTPRIAQSPSVDAIAAAVHEGRFSEGKDQSNYCTFEDECESGKIYCRRIASSVIAALAPGNGAVEAQGRLIETSSEAELDAALNTPEADVIVQADGTCKPPVDCFERFETRFKKLVDSLQEWRNRDHADNITLSRSQVIDLIEGVKYVRRVKP